MAKEYRTIRNDVALPYQWALGKTWTRFFDGLKEEKIQGTKCDDCGKVYVPARTFCPDCFRDLTQWVDIKPQGTILSWTIVKVKYVGQVQEPPYVIALIKLDGSDCGFNHFIGGVDLSDTKTINKILKTGKKVKALWRTTKNGDINDIECFVPIK